MRLRPSPATSEYLRSLLTVAAWVVIWAVLAILPVTGRFLPRPLTIASEVVDSLATWAPHWAATMTRSLISLALSAVLAGLLSSFVVVVPRVKFILLALAASFSFPLVILVPLTTIVADSDVVPIVISVVSCFFPMLFQFWQGMQEVDRIWLDLGFINDSSSIAIMRYVRFPASIPSFLAGLEAALPAAFLGSMLGELAGSRWGLGVYLISTLSTGSPVKAGAVTLICVVSTLVPFLIAITVRRRANLRRGMTAVPLDDGLLWLRQQTSLKDGLTAFCLGLLFWWSAALVASNTYFFKGPLATIRYLLGHQDIWLAFGASALTAIGGLVLGVLLAAVLALGTTLIPALRSFLVGPLLISQSTPIVALVPILAVLLGRGASIEAAITVSASFFPCLLVFQHAMDSTPQALLDVGVGVGARRWLLLRLIRLPASSAQLLGGVRLAAQRAFLGALLAEYVATRNGLGGLVYDSRGRLEFQPIWAAALLCVLASQMIDMTVRLLVYRWSTVEAPN
jgi:sulfonate transport system permease protein